MWWKMASAKSRNLQTGPKIDENGDLQWMGQVLIGLPILTFWCQAIQHLNVLMTHRMSHKVFAGKILDLRNPLLSAVDLLCTQSMYSRVCSNIYKRKMQLLGKHISTHFQCKRICWKLAGPRRRNGQIRKTNHGAVRKGRSRQDEGGL